MQNGKNYHCQSDPTIYLIQFICHCSVAEKEDHQATVVTYSEEEMYDEVSCDCDDCEAGLEHPDHETKHHDRDSAYLYELDDPIKH